jgi:hypothetical protein
MKTLYRKITDKRKTIAYVFFISLCINYSSYSQVTAFYNKSQVFKFSNINLWDWTVVNSSNTTLTCYFTVQINSIDNQQIINVKSSNISIKVGSNNLSRSLASENYVYIMNSPLVTDFKQGGSLPTGSYKICINIYSKENIILSDNCAPILVNDISSIRLIQPFNEEKIYTLYPMLSWTPYLGKENISYNICLAPIMDGQEKIEALSKNILYLDRNIGTVTLSYPNDAFKLESGQKYAWQVHAKYNDKVIASTEVWEFEINSVSSKISSSQDCYRLVKKNGTSAPYLNNGILKFAYENRSNEEELNYKIIDASKGSFLDRSKKIELHSGVNKIDINLNEINGLKKGQQYTLELTDLFNQHYKLIFKYN